MFDFIFRKKPTIFLLLAIIFISLIFSILLNNPLHEGMENATINNPPPDIINKAYDILKKDDKTDLDKLNEVRSLLQFKYKILGDIYRQNERSILKELENTLSNPPKRDGDGKLIDPNALTGSNRENAVKLLSSNDYSAMEKIMKISDIGGQDKIIKNTLDEYIKAFIEMVKSNIAKLKTTENDVVVPIPSP
jgi:hypothetical protein